MIKTDTLAIMIVILIGICAASVMIILPLKWQIALCCGVFLIAAIAIYLPKEDILFGVLLITLAFHVDKIIIPFPYMGGSPGLRIALEDIILFALFVIYLFTLKNSAKKRTNLKTIVSVSWALFFFVAFMSYVTSGFPLSGLALLIDIIRCFGVFFFAVNYFRTEKRVYAGIVLLIITVGIQGIIALFQYNNAFAIPGLEILGQSGRLYQEAWQSTEEIRPGGTLGGPNDLAHYLVLIMPLGAVLLMRKIWSWSGLLSCLCLILGICALVLTFSRMGWVAFMFGIGLYFILLLKKAKLAKFLAPSIISVFVFGSIVFLYFPIIDHRLFAQDYGAAYARIPMLKTSFYVIASNPILGVGINNYCDYVKHHDVTGIYRQMGKVHPVHNAIALHFAETGIIGGGLFCWLWAICIYQVWRCFRANNQFTFVLAATCLAGMVGEFIFLQAQWWYIEAYLPFWVCLSLCIGMEKVDCGA